MERWKEAVVLGVGIDWAEEFHLVALGRPGQGVVEVVQVGHNPRAVDALIDKIVELEPDPVEVRVVIETRHGLLVDRLVDAGFVVLPVNPDLISRRRGPAKKKDDAEDARIGCLLALDRFAGLRPLIPHGPVASELRAIARDDERAARDERRLLNRLRADLLTVFPAAVAIGGENMGAPTFLRMLAQWPTAEALGSVSRDELVAFARAQRSGYGERFAERVQTALAAEQFRAPAHLVRAKVDTIRLAAAQLLLIGAQRRAWERRMSELLLDPARAASSDTRDTSEDDKPEREPGQAFPGGEIYLSFPGLGARLAARIAGEIGDHIEQFATPNSLQCYAGAAPVTRRSGKRELVVAHRLACNHHLADAIHKWAFASLRRSAWAKEFYQAKRAGGNSHNAALRALGNRWLEILWHCLTKAVPYDEATHVANRNRALTRPADTASTAA
ncbi:MAG TPA: transposase [Actinomycetota bacterium]|nr:transposase [Actinomycetota bacterium]